MRFLLVFFSLAAFADTVTLTLKEAVARALRESPALQSARLDERRAQLEAQAVAEPLLPRVVTGSGLGYNNGMPLSIEGSAPSVVRAQAIKEIWNPARRHQVAASRELARGAAHSTAAVRESTAHRVALLYLDLERYERSRQTAERQRENVEQVLAVVRARLGEDRELPIEEKKVQLSLARVRQRILAYENARTAAGRELALAIGMKADGMVLPVIEERGEMPLPASVEESIQQGLAADAEVKKLESDLVAKTFEARSYRAARLPRFDLQAQYGLLARFNNYDDYFRTFTRHNGQVGISVQVPVFGSPQDDARAAQREAEAGRIRLQIQESRNRLAANTERAWARIREAEAGREVARLDLEVARQQVTDLLAQMEEGRASLRQVEEARFLENEKWLGLYEARALVERARIDLLKETSTLTAALR
jgi:outer membrane protein TolC